MSKVVILQERMTHYRVRLFELVRDLCARRGISVHVVYGQASRREAARRDEGFLASGRKVRNRFVALGDRDFVWQCFPADLRDADLVILPQENRIFSSYPLLLSRIWRPWKVAYWGHGRNLQSAYEDGWRERWKRLLVGVVDWWFAYTELTKRTLQSAGYPLDRVTVLNNTIDTAAFAGELASVSDGDLAQVRASLGLDAASRVGLYCGSLYPDKGLDFLINAADRVQAAVPTFHLVVLGDGPSAKEVENAAASRPWLHWVGPRRDADKAGYFRLAQVIVHPALVGVHVLDSFIAGVPMVAVADGRHGPEIVYLESGVNGLLVERDIGKYAEAVVSILTDAKLSERLRSSALNSAKQYTLEAMAKNFVDGIEHCIAKRKRA